MKNFVLTALLFIAPMFAQLSQPTKSIDVVILAGTAVSAPINMGTCVPVAFVLPVMSPAADFTFLSSVNGTDFTSVWDSYNTEVTVQTGPGTTARTVLVSAGDWYFSKHLKIRRGTTASPTNTTGNLNFTVSCK